MRKTKQISIRTETREVVIITRSGSLKNPSWCERCASEVRWLTFGDAAKTNHLAVERLSIFVEAGSVHFRETIEGHLLLCVDSLRTLNSGQP